MKSIILLLVSVCCLIASARAAAIETVVEELIKDDVQQSVTESGFTTNEDCIQPKETGRCFALFYRFAFDLEKRTCVEFIYGGCAGNSNNFETKEDCEAKCMTKLEDTIDDASTTVEPESKTVAIEQAVSS